MDLYKAIAYLKKELRDLDRFIDAVEAAAERHQAPARPKVKRAAAVVRLARPEELPFLPTALLEAPLSSPWRN